MILSDDIKDSIRKEFSDWVETQYAGKSKEERQKFGQFFTPPELTIKMLEKFEDLNGTILDPTAGCGGLLAAAVLAGANPRKCYGIELDPDIAALCRDRLAKLGVPRFNIHIGDALKDDSYNFSDTYEDKSLLYFKITDLGLSQVNIFLERNTNGKVVAKNILIDYSKSEIILSKIFLKIYKALSIFEREPENQTMYLVSDDMKNNLNYLNSFFKKYIHKELHPT